MARTTASSLVYLGIRGTVIALDRRTGAEQWRTPLKGSDFVNVVLDGELLLATARGEIFALHPGTGRILWNNPLKGMGWGLATIANSAIPPMAQRRAMEEAASTQAATTHTVVL
jgi:outer membrane protein assembly factor BamB